MSTFQTDPRGGRSTGGEGGAGRGEGGEGGEGGGEGLVETETSDTSLNDLCSIRASVSGTSRGFTETKVFLGAGKGFTLTGALKEVQNDLLVIMNVLTCLALAWKNGEKGLLSGSGLGSGSEKGEVNLRLAAPEQVGHYNVRKIIRSLTWERKALALVPVLGESRGISACSEHDNVLFLDPNIPPPTHGDLKPQRPLHACRFVWPRHVMSI